MGIGIMDANGNTTKVDKSKLSYKDGTLTIDKSAFEGLDAGTYTIGFVFDDSNSTVDVSNVTLVVKGIKKEASTDDSKTDTDSSDSDKTDSATDSSTGTTEKTE